MDLLDAMYAHSEWKVTFRTAISRQERLDEAVISADCHCELGKWLHGDARLQFGTLASYAECVRKHAAFHEEAGKVAQNINTRNFAEAEAMLGPDSAFTTASATVCSAIMRLRKDAGV